MSMRITRKSLGDKLRDRRRVANPEFDIPAKSFNRAFSVIAGVSQAGAQAWALFNWVPNESNRLTVLSHAELWNPNGGPAPIGNRTAAGNYTIVYPATYSTPEGGTGSLALYGAIAVPQTLSKRDGRAMIIENIKADVRIYDESDVLQDEPFLVLVW